MHRGCVIELGNTPGTEYTCKGRIGVCVICLTCEDRPFPTALQVSVGWLLYNSLAPIMLLWYCLFRNRGLTHLCTFISMVTTVILIGIIVIIWLVLPKEFDWNQQLRNSLTFFDAQKSGVLPASNPIPWRGNSALNDTAPNGASLVGGYYIDGGNGSPNLDVLNCLRLWLL